MVRLLAALLVGVVACVPDLGGDAPAEGLDTEVTTDTQEMDSTPLADTTHTDAADTSDLSAGLCDDTPPSATTEVYVWAHGRNFYFTPPPANGDMSRLYVPANARVHLRLATSPTENAHSFAIALTGCELESPMGAVGAEVEVDWKAPRFPAIYDGGSSPAEPGMTFQIVVL